MGRPKQLLLVNGKPAVRYCAETILTAGIAHVLVVVAKDSHVEAAVQSLPVQIVFNEDPASDMAGSVRAGLKAFPPDTRFGLVCLADHPLVMSGTIQSILAQSARNPVKIIIPRYHGRRGHPTLFPRSILNEVLLGQNLHQIINNHSAHVEYIDVHDEGVVLDMDTEGDYEKIRQRGGSS
jgi:molybdenum cofactor cytidylyltransferase